MSALGREIERVVERLRTLSAARLAAPAPPYGDRADAGRALAQHLADAAVGISAGSTPEPPPWRPVPRLAPFGVADQVAVTAQEFLDAADALDPWAPVWTPAGRRDLAGVVADVRQEVAAVRRAL